MHNVEYWYWLIIQSGRKKSSSHKYSQWQAWMSLQKEKNKGESSVIRFTLTISRCRTVEREPGERLKASDLLKAASDEWKTMSIEERAEHTKAPLQQLRERKEMRSSALHNVAINSFNDARATLDSIVKQVCSVGMSA